MDASPDEGDYEASIESSRNCQADDKAAFVVVVAPEKWHEDKTRKLLIESLKNDGVPHALVKDSQMSEAQKSLGNEIEKINVENLIIVVIADGFYHDDGEAIIFEDSYVLLDTFIHPFIAIADEKRQCKIKDTALSKLGTTFR